MAIKTFNILPELPAPVRAIERIAENLQNVLPFEVGDRYLLGPDGKTGLSKRTFDLLGIAAVAPAVIPIASLLTGIKFVEDGHNPIFKQKRVGKQKFEDQFPGIFEMYKIRSMVPDASCENKVYFKQKNDPRVTWFGKLLRATSLDELPNLINVAIGDMSLGGPRPVEPLKRIEIADETALYDEQLAKAYLRTPEAVIPGMFGDDAIYGRALLYSDKKYYPDLAQFEVNYRQTASLVKDAELVINGLYIVLSGRGAC